MVVDLGDQPSGGVFPTPDQLPAERLPLRLGVCRACGLAQLADHSPPEADDPDAPSPLSSATIGAHAQRLIEDLARQDLVRPGSHTLSLASHGGHVAGILHDRGARCTAVDSVPERVRRMSDAGLAAVWGAIDATGAPGLETLGTFELIVDFYLLAHLGDPRGAIGRMSRLLAPGGTIVLEFDHLLATVEGGQWDAIRHGHQAYLTLAWVKREAEAAGLTVVDAVAQPVYGGAMRVQLRTGGSPSMQVDVIVDRENEASLDQPGGLAPLRDAVALARREVVAHLKSARAESRQIVGYGAPARSITFLNALAIGPDLLPFVVDRSPAKHGRMIPGAMIPIRSPDVLDEATPSEILVLTWDLVDEIRESLAPLVARGSRMVVALPRLIDVTAASTSG